MFSSVVIIYSQLCAFFFFCLASQSICFFCDAYTEGRHTLKYENMFYNQYKCVASNCVNMNWLKFPVTQLKSI